MSEAAPVRGRHAEAGDAVGLVELAGVDVLGEGRRLGQVDDAHVLVRDDEELGADEANDGAADAVLLDGVAPRLDVELVDVALAEAEHVVELGIKGHARRLLRGEDDVLGPERDDLEPPLAVDDREALAVAAHVEAGDAALGLDELDGEGVVDVDLQHRAVVEAHEQTLPARGAAVDLQTGDRRVEDLGGTRVIRRRSNVGVPRARACQRNTCTVPRDDRSSKPRWKTTERGAV